MRERPVFVLAGGGRTGSTLVQRLLISTGAVLVWGEHGGRIVPALGSLLRGMEAWLGQEASGQLELLRGRGGDAFIPNVNPEAEAFVRGARALFQAALGDTAREMGFARWGFKEIRYGCDEALLLRRIFPVADFVAVVRDPAGALASIKSADWYARDYGAAPEAFLERWATLSSGLLDAIPKLGPGLLLRYEDLVARPAETLARLGLHAGIDPAAFRRDVLGGKLRGTEIPPVPLDSADRAALAAPAVRRVAAALGYG